MWRVFISIGPSHNHKSALRTPQYFATTTSPHNIMVQKTIMTMQTFLSSSSVRTLSVSQTRLFRMTLMVMGVGLVAIASMPDVGYFGGPKESLVQTASGGEVFYELTELQTHAESTETSTYLRSSSVSPSSNSTRTNKHNVYYSQLRRDRSGQVIADMLKAHAACFRNGWTYGGACDARSPAKQHKKDVAHQLQAMGLDKVLPIACPLRHSTKKKHYLHSYQYLHEEQENYTPEWLAYMRQEVEQQTKNKKNKKKKDMKSDTDVLSIAVHLRRGDVSLCTDNADRRYLPNSHYIRLLDQLLANVTSPYQVTIYTESEEHYGGRPQYETLDVFTSRGYKVQMDGSRRDVWRAFLAADVLVTAKSAFSLVPALLRFDRDGTIFTPHQFAHALPHWQVLDSSFMETTEMDMKQLQAQKCPSESSNK